MIPHPIRQLPRLGFGRCCQCGLPGYTFPRPLQLRHHSSNGSQPIQHHDSSRPRVRPVIVGLSGVVQCRKRQLGDRLSCA